MDSKAPSNVSPNQAISNTTKSKKPRVITLVLIGIVLTLLAIIWWREKTWRSRLNAVDRSTAQVQKSISPTPTNNSGDFELKAKLLYPRESSTISNTTPTIIGKFNQPESLALPAKSELKNFVHYNDKIHRGVSFFPAALKNTKLTINEETAEIVHGFPQYPYILCSELVEGEFNEKISKEVCVRENLSEVPPAIFFYKPQKKLTPGEQNLELNVAGKKYNFKFNVDPNYDLSDKELPKQLPSQYFNTNFSYKPLLNRLFDITAQAGHDNPVRNKIDAVLRSYGDDVLYYDGFVEADRCTRGYHYPAELLPVPLPLFESEEIYYRLHLPDQTNNFGGRKGTEISFRMGTETYDLNLPSASELYFDNEIKTQDNGRKWIPGNKAFYIPIIYMNYTDSTESLSRYLSSVNTDNTRSDILFNYLEYMPYDYAETPYKENLLLYRTINSSACDG